MLNMYLELLSKHNAYITPHICMCPHEFLVGLIDVMGGKKKDFLKI